MPVVNSALTGYAGRAYWQKCPDRPTHIHRINLPHASQVLALYAPFYRLAVGSVLFPAPQVQWYEKHYYHAESGLYLRGHSALEHMKRPYRRDDPVPAGYQQYLESRHLNLCRAFLSFVLYYRECR